MMAASNFDTNTVERVSAGPRSGRKKPPVCRIRRRRRPMGNRLLPHHYRQLNEVEPFAYLEGVFGNACPADIQ